jgi:YXWGXW repeat-containing protein
MRIQTLISAGFATAALTSASIPALAWTVWPDIDFEWYADVGRPLAYPQYVEITPAPRAGYIWAPGHWETRDLHQQWVAGHWVKDDYAEQVAVYRNGRTTTYATGSPILYDSQGNVIPTDPNAYPVDSARR